MPCIQHNTINPIRYTAIQIMQLCAMQQVTGSSKSITAKWQLAGILRDTHNTDTWHDFTIVMIQAWNSWRTEVQTNPFVPYKSLRFTRLLLCPQRRSPALDVDWEVCKLSLFQFFQNSHLRQFRQAIFILPVLAVKGQRLTRFAHDSESPRQTPSVCLLAFSAFLR